MSMVVAEKRKYLISGCGTGGEETEIEFFHNL